MENYISKIIFTGVALEGDFGQYVGKAKEHGKCKYDFVNSRSIYFKRRRSRHNCPQRCQKTSCSTAIRNAMAKPSIPKDIPT